MKRILGILVALVMVSYTPFTTHQNVWADQTDVVILNNSYVGQDWVNFTSEVNYISQSNPNTKVFGVFVDGGSEDETPLWDQALGLNIPMNINFYSPNSPHTIGLLIKVDSHGEITGICYHTWNASWLTVEQMDLMFFQSFPDYNSNQTMTKFQLIEFIRLITSY